MSIEDTKEKIELRRHVFEWELENKFEIKIQNGMTCMNNNEVKNISVCNLLHGIPNAPKLAKN